MDVCQIVVTDMGGISVDVVPTMRFISKQIHLITVIGDSVVRKHVQNGMEICVCHDKSGNFYRRKSNFELHRL